MDDIEEVKRLPWYRRHLWALNTKFPRPPPYFRRPQRVGYMLSEQLANSPPRYTLNTRTLDVQHATEPIFDNANNNNTRKKKIRKNVADQNLIKRLWALLSQDIDVNKYSRILRANSTADIKDIGRGLNMRWDVSASGLLDYKVTVLNEIIGLIIFILGRVVYSTYTRYNVKELLNTHKRVLSTLEAREAARLRNIAEERVRASGGSSFLGTDDALVGFNVIGQAVSAPLQIFSFFSLFAGGARMNVRKTKQKGGSLFAIFAVLVVGCIVFAICSRFEEAAERKDYFLLISLHKTLFEGGLINTVLDRLNFFNLTEQQRAFLLETGNAGYFATMTTVEFVPYLTTFLLKGINEETVVQRIQEAGIEGGPPSAVQEAAVLPPSSAAGTGLVADIPPLPGTAMEPGLRGGYKTRRRKRKYK